MVLVMKMQIFTLEVCLGLSVVLCALYMTSRAVGAAVERRFLSRKLTYRGSQSLMHNSNPQTLLHNNDLLCIPGIGLSLDGLEIPP